MLDLEKVKVVGLRKPERGEFYFAYGNVFTEDSGSKWGEYAVIEPREGFRFIPSGDNNDSYKVVPVTRKYTLIKVPGHFANCLSAIQAAYSLPLRQISSSQIEE